MYFRRAGLRALMIVVVGVLRACVRVYFSEPWLSWISAICLPLLSECWDKKHVLCWKSSILL